MSLLNPFERLSKRSLIPSTNFTPFVVSNGQIVPTNFVDASTALKNSDIFAVTNLISSDLASATFKNCPFNILNNPSELINSFSFWQSAYLQLLLTGNTYLAIYKDNKGVPNRLEQIPTSQVTVNLADDSSAIAYQINYQDDRDNVQLDADEMIHIRLMPFGENGNQFIGRSPLESLPQMVAIQDQANKLSLSTLQNAINPSTTITVPDAKLSKEAKDTIRDDFQALNTGANFGKAIVLDQSAKLATQTINADVAKFLSTTTFTQTQIAKAFGIPDSYLNGQGDQQSSLEQITTLYANSLNKYILPIQSELQVKLFPTIQLDITQALDFDNSRYISMIESLATSKALTAQQAINALADRGLLDANKL